MRADIYEPENAEKIYSAIRQIKERTGIEPSFSRVVNLMISAIDSIESIETLTIILKADPEAQHGGEFQRKKKKKIVKRSNWITNIK